MAMKAGVLKFFHSLLLLWAGCLLCSGAASRAATSVVGWGATVVPAGLTNVVSVSAGHHFSLALKKDGTVVGWASDGTMLTNIPPSLSNVVSIAAGAFHSLALKADGGVT